MSEVLTVAANNSSDMDKAHADYVCNGLDDQVQIRKALDILKSSGGGTVLLREGKYNALLFGTEDLVLDGKVIIKGVCGKSTEISKGCE